MAERQAFTIVSVPKAFHGKADIIQRNAIKSWTHLKPRPEIILMGNEEGTAGAASDFGCKNITGIKTNSFRTPLINDIFIQAQRKARHNVIVYVNADIILMQDFCRALRQIRAQKFKNFLAIGQRTNMDVDSVLDLTKSGWQRRLRVAAKEKGELFSPYGIDYFVFPKGLWKDIPALVLGRFTWDNWLVNRALVNGATLIDLTEVVCAVHQNHEYRHIAGKRKNPRSGPEYEANMGIIKDAPYIRNATIKLARHKITAQGIVAVKPFFTIVVQATDPDALASILTAVLCQSYSALEEVLVASNSKVFDIQTIIKGFETTQLQVLQDTRVDSATLSNRIVARSVGKFIIWLEDSKGISANFMKSFLTVLQKNPRSEVFYYQDCVGGENNISGPLVIRKDVYRRFGLYRSADGASWRQEFWNRIRTKVVASMIS